MSEASTALVETQTATLVKVANRDRSIVGWKYIAVETHLFNHQHQGTIWCEVACLARTIFGRDSEKNRKAVRQRLRGVARQMIAHHRFLVIEYAPKGCGTHGEAQRFKIYQGTTADEVQAAEQQLEAMRHRGEVNETNYNAARQILRVVTTVKPDGE